MSLNSPLKSIFKVCDNLRRKNILKTQVLLMSSYVPKIPSVPWLEPPNLDGIKEQFKNYDGGEVTVNLDEQSGIAYLLLSHPNKRNSLSGKMMVQLSEAVEKLENWETGKGLILHTPGDLFCSGAFLDTVKQIIEPEDGFKMSCLMHDNVIRLRNLPLVSVAVVQGKALGGGAEILLSTDFRLVTPKTEIKYVQSSMGICPGWGGGQLLKLVVGQTKALDFLLTGRKIDMDEALKIGLADGVVQFDTRLEESVEWLNSRIGALDANVVRANKLSVACSSFSDERQILSTVWGGEAQKKMLSLSVKHK